MPSGLSDLEMESLFEIQFVRLPHKKYENEKFQVAVDNLRTRLGPEPYFSIQF